jgi:hypothetical protein
MPKKGADQKMQEEESKFENNDDDFETESEHTDS